MMKTVKTGAVISAAGHHIDAPFQPLLPIGKTTIIRRIIIMLKQADIDPIIVITGQQAEEVEKHISRMRVICLRNEDYETTQMYDSLCMGLNYIEDLCDRVLFLPVKYPMFLSDTIEMLLGTQKKAACPVYQNRRGHPVILSKDLIPLLLRYSGNQGLRGALRQEEINAHLEEIPVEDQGIILAIEEDRDCILNYDRSRKIPVHSVAQLYIEGDDIFFGPGIAQFLTLVDHTGSMQTACRQMHMSYSKGWHIVKDAEKHLGFPLLSTKSGGSDGGSSVLTPKSRDYLKRYLAMEQEVQQAAKALFQKYFADLP